MSQSKTQVDALLEAFKRGEILSALDSAQKYGILPFSQRICDIERRGYTVYRYWVTPESGKAFMKYFIPFNQFREVA